MKNIKTKEKVQNIKTVDKKNNHHFEKQINFNEKKQNTEKNHQENDGQHYAIKLLIKKRILRLNQNIVFIKVLNIENKKGKIEILFL